MRLIVFASGSTADRSGAAECSLSDVLETGDVPQRYFLSGKACRGILRRAEKRGKTLPSQLHRALTEAAHTEKRRETILSPALPQPPAPATAVAAG